MTPRGLVTAGQRVAVAADRSPGLASAVQQAAGEPLEETTGSSDLLLDRLDRDPRELDLDPVTRGVWAGPDGVVFDSVGGSGFQQVWRLTADTIGPATSRCLNVSSRWSPSVAEAAAARMLPHRNRALRGQVLLHHPALWSAMAIGGLSPLHVSVVEVDGVGILLAGPGGVGKSSLVADALARGARATCDNIGVSDGRVVHGLVEPLRLPRTAGSSGGGARAAHGRREHHLEGRVPTLRPDLVLVVRRDDHGDTRLRPLRTERATRALVSGTYAAGELLRFWPLVASLALAGFGPPHPALETCASRLATALPCYELTLGRPDAGRPATSGARLGELLGGRLAEARQHSEHTSLTAPTDGRTA